MSDEINSGKPMTDEEFKKAVEELSGNDGEQDAPEPEAQAEQPTPVKGTGKLRTELAKLEKRRVELKHTKKDDLAAGEFAEVKTRIAEIKALLGE